MARTGRPSKYDKDRHPELAHWMAKSGLTDEEIAEEFGIHPATLYRWMIRHEEFREAIKDAKATPDLLVEQSLYQRAIGYEYTETRTYGKVRTVEGKQEVIAEKMETIRKQVAPDVTAQIFWLCNRDREKWQRNPDVMILPADEAAPIIIHRNGNRKNKDEDESD